MTVEELNKRISQLTALLISAEDTIKNTNEMIKLAEQERDRLADEREKSEPEFERKLTTHSYWHVATNFGEPIIHVEHETNGRFDDKCFENNNYFHTKERAKEVANKIKFLLKLERLHDIYCPDYKAEDDGDDKYRIVFCDGMYQWEQDNYTIDFSAVYFPTEEIAQKVCDILNKECEENDNS